MPLTNARKAEIRSQYREAMRFEQSRRPAPSTLTADLSVRSAEVR